MKIRLTVLLFSTILIYSCRTYLDTAKNSIVTDYMTFKFKSKYNELDYFNKINARADNDIFYTTHFSINLPKGIIYWERKDNKFYFEYSSKQIIYIYSAYKNDEKESDTWELADPEGGKEFSYLDQYWVNDRHYDENDLYKRKKERKTKLYTNGKYKILLFNIKEKNYPTFLESIKTFRVK